MRRSGGGAAQHDLLVQRAIPEAPVQSEHAHEPRLVRRAQGRDAVRLSPRELAALDRAGDAAPSILACDARKPVPPRLVLEAEEAVAEDAAVLEREEVRLSRVRVEAPGPPFVEAVEPVLRPTGLIGIGLARDREDRLHEVRAFGERHQLERGRVRVVGSRDVELRDGVAPHLLVAALLEEADHLGRRVGRPGLEPRLADRPCRRGSLAPGHFVDLVEPDLRPRELLEPGDRLDVHCVIELRLVGTRPRAAEQTLEVGALEERDDRAVPLAQLPRLPPLARHEPPPRRRALDVDADRRQVEVGRHRFDDAAVFMGLEPERVRLVLPRDAVLVQEARVFGLRGMRKPPLRHEQCSRPARERINGGAALWPFWTLSPRPLSRHACRVPRLELALVAAIVVFAALLLVTRPRPGPPPSPYCREGPPLAGVYHPARLEVKKPCAIAAGVVTKVKFEEFDGDVHVGLRTDDGEVLVVEVIPQDRAVVPIPDTGARVTVVGPSVWDSAHGWAEIHRAWWISSGRIVAASAQELARVQSLLRDTRADQEVNDE